MKLNLDCIRDILLAVEDAPFNEEIKLFHLVKQLPKYSEDELWYTCEKLHEGGYLEAVTTKDLQNTLPIVVSILGLTYRGHQYLESIRDPKIWSKTKEIAGTAGASTLKALGTIAQNVVTAGLTAALSKGV